MSKEKDNTDNRDRGRSRYPNHSLLYDTFFYNLTHNKYLFTKFHETTRLYR